MQVSVLLPLLFFEAFLALNAQGGMGTRTEAENTDVSVAEATVVTNGALAEISALEAFESSLDRHSSHFLVPLFVFPFRKLWFVESNSSPADGCPYLQRTLVYIFSNVY